ncbi:hypothetical protein NFI96_001667 [Prochilodus magdalenae]|nr:hypothetical protein NFI96_001667 [Prochilodus magdalenae]
MENSSSKTTVLAAAAFLDAFQKVADMATSTRGATRDIGSALTRMCMRHRSIEAKLRHFTNALMEKLITPLQDKIEEWKKTAALLDKDHAKEYKRSRQEIKKKSSDTLKLQKKARKGRGGLQPQLDSAMQDVSDMYLLMEETEKQAVRRALLEERGRYCTFISFLQPVVVSARKNGEIAMLGEVTHLQAIIDDLTVLTTDPHKLPEASEQVYSLEHSLVHLPPGGAHRLSSVSSHDSGFISQDANMHSKPPSPMPSDITSQKSSSSASSEASETCQSVSECGSPTAFGSSFATFRPAHIYNGTIRPLSFIAPASPSFNHSPGSNSPSPTSKVPHWKQDWAKAAQYEQPGAVLQRRSEAADPSGGLRGNGMVYPEDPYRTRANTANITGKHGKPMISAASELAMVLTRGLSLEQQKSSCDSLQYSSGYSTQNTTPSCSEDTIPSHALYLKGLYCTISSDYDCYSMNGDVDSDAQTDFDKSSTVPRHSNLAQNYRRMIQTKRPASTAGLPGGVGVQGSPAANGKGASGGTVISSGTATIRRTPSSKTGVRRVPSNVGPIPIRPPIVPVKTPTVPDSPGFPSPPPEFNGSEESLYSEDSLEIMEYKASPKRMSLPNSAWGSSMSMYTHQPGAMGLSTEEDQLLAANRHSLVEKIGELVANAHALGEGQYPFPTDSQPSQGHQEDPPPAAGEGDMLKSIRRGVRLRKAVCNDRNDWILCYTVIVWAAGQRLTTACLLTARYSDDLSNGRCFGKRERSTEEKKTSYNTSLKLYNCSPVLGCNGLQADIRFYTSSSKNVPLWTYMVFFFFLFFLAYESDEVKEPDMQIHMSDTGHYRDDNHEKAEKGAKTWSKPRKRSLLEMEGKEDAQKVLRCMYCGHSFESLQDLSVHMIKTKHYQKVPLKEPGTSIGSKVISAFKKRAPTELDVSKMNGAEQKRSCKGTLINDTLPNATDITKKDVLTDHSEVSSAFQLKPQILRCTECRSSYESLQQLTAHIMLTGHFARDGDSSKKTDKCLSEQPLLPAKVKMSDEKTQTQTQELSPALPGTGTAHESPCTPSPIANSSNDKMQGKILLNEGTCREPAIENDADKRYNTSSQFDYLTEDDLKENPKVNLDILKSLENTVTSAINKAQKGTPSWGGYQSIHAAYQLQNNTRPSLYNPGRASSIKQLVHGMEVQSSDRSQLMIPTNPPQRDLSPTVNLHAMEELVKKVTDRDMEEQRKSTDEQVSLQRQFITSPSRTADRKSSASSPPIVESCETLSNTDSKVADPENNKDARSSMKCTEDFAQPHASSLSLCDDSAVITSHPDPKRPFVSPLNALQSVMNLHLGKAAKPVKPVQDPMTMLLKMSNTMAERAAVAAPPIPSLKLEPLNPDFHHIDKDQPIDLSKGKKRQCLMTASLPGKVLSSSLPGMTRTDLSNILCTPVSPVHESALSDISDMLRNLSDSHISKPPTPSHKVERSEIEGAHTPDDVDDASMAHKRKGRQSHWNPQHLLILQAQFTSCLRQTADGKYVISDLSPQERMVISRVTGLSMTTISHWLANVKYQLRRTGRTKFLKNVDSGHPVFFCSECAMQIQSRSTYLCHLESHLGFRMRDLAKFSCENLGKKIARHSKDLSPKLVMPPLSPATGPEQSYLA